MFSNTLKIAIASLGFVSITALVALLLITKALTTQVAIPEKVACFFEIKADCSIPAFEKYERKIEQLEKRERELEAKIDHLRKLEEGVENVTLFANAPLGRGSYEVETGVRYDRFIDIQEWSNAWCHMRLPNGSDGLSSYLSIASATPLGGVREHSVSNRSLSAAGLSKQDIETALNLCQWPQNIG